MNLADGDHFIIAEQFMVNHPTVRGCNRLIAAMIPAPKRDVRVQTRPRQATWFG